MPSYAISAELNKRFEFENGQLNTDYWCPCQIDMQNAPIEFLPDPEDPTDSFVRITANRKTLGGNVCHIKTECHSPFTTFKSTHQALFATSLFKVPSTKNLFLSEFVTTENPFCTPERLQQAFDHGEEIDVAESGHCLQRQEVRLQKSFRHAAKNPHDYTIRFKMSDLAHDKENSLRWVIMQWKHDIDPIYYGFGFEPSPFLAQRYDDGVHHITVQDEECRCIIASAHNPKEQYKWEDGSPKYCRNDAGKTCNASLHVNYGNEPVLSPPAGNWVEMKFRVQASRKNATIIIVENGRFIARVSGKIGYKPSTNVQSRVKFKFGQYRDFQETEDYIDVDYIQISKSK